MSQSLKHKHNALTTTPPSQPYHARTRMVQLPATAAIEYVAACCRTRTRTRTKTKTKTRRKLERERKLEQ